MRTFAQKQNQPRESADLFRASWLSAPPHQAHPLLLPQAGAVSGVAYDFSRIPIDAPAAEEADAVHAAAVRGAAGSGGPLPHLAAIQRSFGRHDLSGIRAHVGGPAADASSAIGAIAYATGNAVAFSAAPDLRLAAHEAAHVVQQRAGVDLPGGVGQPGDRYENQADAVAARVVEGRSAEHLLDSRTGNRGGGRAVQRFAFLNEKQIGKIGKDYTPAMQGMVADSVVRNYTSVDEFKKHAGKQTDYLGNLADGTWMRFEPTGINLLGENHTRVTLEMVVPAVGSKSFIYEPISSDVLAPKSNIRAAYETEAQPFFKAFGIEKEKDKQPFGAESLFPKMGFALNLAVPYFEGRQPMSDLESGGYVGQPVQRYLKIAWGYSKDNKARVEQKVKAKMKVSPKADALAKVHAAVESKLDKFITGLVVDGYIGDELKKPGNAALLPPLAQFAKAFTDAMVEMAATEKSSRLSSAERKALSGSKGISEQKKEALFSQWRDFLFEDNVKAATKRGVRYAGMGQAHLDHLVQIGLEKNQHPFEMDGKDIARFISLTDKLKKAAKKP